MTTKDRIWLAFLEISKRWTRSGLVESLHPSIESLDAKSVVVSIGGFGKIDDALRTMVYPITSNFVTLDIDPEHEPDILGDIQDLRKGLELIPSRPNLIIALEVLEHVPDPRTALMQCYESLEENGMLIFSTPWIIPIHDRPHDYWRFTPYAIRLLTKDFSQVTILARGDQLDSLIALMLRGLFSDKVSLRLFLILGSTISLLRKKPATRVAGDSLDSTIGYIAFCKK